MFVKICGITNREDAMGAVEAGARAIGFVFAESPRAVTADQIAPWINEIPPDIWKVGVFVDEARERIEQIGAQLGLDIAQLHGAETPAGHPRGLRIWKAFRVQTADAPVPDYPAEAILIDGPAWDWSQAAHLAHLSRRPLILAGGLNPENVGEAIRRARLSLAKLSLAKLSLSNPWAVDVSSGIEASPGRKDHARMKEFIDAVLRS